MYEDHMKKALESRRGKGIDVSIILGPHEEDQGSRFGVQPTDKEFEHAEKEKSSDMAPPPDHPLDKDHDGFHAGMNPMPHSPLSEMKDSDLLDGMSHYDKEQSASREPRSLQERARKSAIMAATSTKK